ncbi:MAG: acetoacetate--CoA ligase [Alphaproteobacteria bacterium]|nr:acetoacetate--CoA ligase [Alphaproteobacteria bacterium]
MNDTKPEALWTPSKGRVDGALITEFIGLVREKSGVSCADYRDLYAFSIDEMESFWTCLWDFAHVIAQTRGDVVLADPDRMPGARFFPDARLNFAENLLRRRDAADALVFWGEDKVRRRMSHAELYDLVSRLAQAMDAMGVGPGDRVAGYLPNMPETIAAMLAAASLGAIWSSCSPDFGAQGVLDRFEQIEPKLLIAVDGYFYNGKTHDLSGRIAEIMAALPSVEQTVVVSYVGLDAAPGAIAWDAFIGPHAPREIEFRQMAFNAPLYVLFSSGTTGQPKCIVHGAGGTLLQHLKEHALLCDIRPDDRVFYFTTCGWMMWNWLVSGLASGATLLLYDGAPGYPDFNVVFDFIDAEKGTLLGTSAKYIDAIAKAGLDPKSTHDLGSLRTLTSTGSPLVAESFDYVYAHIKEDLCLSSITGGTDIVALFAGGNPIGPVWRGEIQARCLGMAVEILDENGKALVQEKGELCCTKPFPSMPVRFWADPDGAKYKAAYFEKFDNIWAHGDFAELTAHDGLIVYGRSDATLNPGGVRIGTAEIYRQVEAMDEVEEALAVGQEWHSDVRIVLFVKLRGARKLDEAIEADIKARIRAGATPRHVPARICQVAAIPRTKSGKIVELAVREVIHGRPVKNKHALANPEALAEYGGFDLSF